jgi:hypothetical protein
VGEITAHGCATARPLLLNHVRKDLREIQGLLRHKNIRTTVRYTHVGYEQTRQTAEASARLWTEVKQVLPGVGVASSVVERTLEPCSARSGASA